MWEGKMDREVWTCYTSGVFCNIFMGYQNGTGFEGKLQKQVTETTVS